MKNSLKIFEATANTVLLFFCHKGCSNKEERVDVSTSKIMEGMLIILFHMNFASVCCFVFKKQKAVLNPLF